VSFKSDPETLAEAGREARDPAVLPPPALLSSPHAIAGGGATGEERGGVGRLHQLEKDMQRRREEQRIERERIAKQKAEEFKRQRQTWIDDNNNREMLMMKQQQQQQYLLAQEWDVDEQDRRAEEGGGAQSSAHGDAPLADPAMPPMVGSSRPASRREALERRQLLERQHHAQERRHEQDVHRNVLDFLDHGKHPERGEEDSSSPGGGVHSNTKAPTAHVAPLSSSAMAREAESRVMSGYRAPTEEEYRARREAVRQQREEAQEEARRNAAYVDEEVERKLWEVDLRVQREVEAELTRAQMAEIAELRARQAIAKYGRSPPSRSPQKPSYTPKMNRLQKF
jgi:hypothetical protein